VDPVDELLCKFKKDDIQFVRFEQPTYPGVLSGMLVPVRNAERFLRKGFPYVTLASAITINNDIALDMAASTGWRNISLFPDFSSYKVIAWSDDAVRMASILVSAREQDDIIYPPDVRTVAQRQIEKLLATHNLHILSSFEHEFNLLHKGTDEPISLSGCYNMHRIAKYAPFFHKVDQNLLKMGINCERLHSEVASGQYEITALPSYGIKGADDAMWIRNGLKEMSEKYEDWRATFVTHLPSLDGFSVIEDDSGAHFNYSLHDTKKGNNIGFAPTAKYFLGGVLHHIRGITAFCCPTPICYTTRFSSPWVSSFGNWGKHNRTTLVRVKGDHFELRLPSSLANPYLVTAAVICAGMHGIEQKIAPPKEVAADMVSEDQRMQKERYTFALPSTLREAVQALQEDQVLKKGLNERFVSYYIRVKEMEIEEMKQYEKKKQRPLFYSLL